MKRKVIRPAPNPPMVNVNGMLCRIVIILNKSPTALQQADCITLGEVVTKELDKVLAE